MPQMQHANRFLAYLCGLGHADSILIFHKSLLLNEQPAQHSLTSHVGNGENGVKKNS